MALGNIYSKFFGFLLGKDLTKALLFSRGIIFISSSDGVPIYSNINSICFRAFKIRKTNKYLLSEPGKKGRLLRSSAKIHPTDQTSTELSYSFQQSNNSGARYLKIKIFQ